jgi:hypothetical protein
MTMINVLVDGKPGQMDESELVKTEGGFEDDNERTSWVEYRLPGSDVIVHRSAAVFLKKAIFGEGAAASF